VLREDVVKEARSWIGTPFRHQGRVKGIGVDCLGLVVEVYRKVLHVSMGNGVVYGRQPHLPTMMAEIRKWADPIDWEAALPGDILLFRFEKDPMHFGIRTDRGFIHSYAGGQAIVIEHNLSEDWIERITSAFRLKELQ
jgi:NlpC/P60 family putative phage cell wall peptidase